MRIIILDRSIETADSLAQLLNLMDHDAIAVYTINEAISSVNFDKAEMALIDVELPDVDAYQVARQLRAANESFVLVAMLGNAFPAEVQKAMSAGFHEYVSKPIDFIDLEKLIEKYGKFLKIDS